jgi:transcriptional regulator with XRE-family HTH domain
MDLRTYLDRNPQSMPALAERLGVSRQALYRYVNGDRLPQPEIMERITKATNGLVRASDFYAYLRDWPDCCSYSGAE